ncbi:ROK family transcriptional regulator [uncultured Demequina sp.]|uniref:ROK family transcriptional regulator n=1 Tax=uncultured Demequina sp. TaxID=693499 RepID=UPI0025F2CEA6|nr:ROK family transcriptional regulator [uncultured Demequina sp.]
MVEHVAGRPFVAGRGSRNEATRRHNLSTLLSLVHHGNGVSRADLTRTTGLNRSTIGLLVADLVAAGLVAESAPATGSVGRPSPIVVPDPDVVAVAINPDVDAVVVGIVGLGGVVHATTRVEQDAIPSVDEVVAAVAAAVSVLTQGRSWRVVGAGVAVPGLVRAREGAVARAPHLLWSGEAVAAPLEAALGVPVAVDNDANAALVAETLFGAARGRRDVIYLNGSVSGIGGSILTDGTVVRGADGFAGELGHTLVRPDGEQCHCGRVGCLETEVNLQRLERAAGEAGIDHAHVSASLGSGSDELAAEVEHQIDTLALATGSFVSIFNPEAVLLGGFLSALQARQPARFAEALGEAVFAPLGERLEIVRAELGDELLMVGAAELAFADLLADPLGAEVPTPS